MTTMLESRPAMMMWDWIDFLLTPIEEMLGEADEQDDLHDEAFKKHIERIAKTPWDEHAKKSAEVIGHHFKNITGAAARKARREHADVHNSLFAGDIERKSGKTGLHHEAQKFLERINDPAWNHGGRSLQQHFAGHVKQALTTILASERKRAGYRKTGAGGDVGATAAHGVKSGGRKSMGPRETDLPASEKSDPREPDAPAKRGERESNPAAAKSHAGGEESKPGIEIAKAGAKPKRKAPLPAKGEHGGAGGHIAGPEERAMSREGRERRSAEYKGLRKQLRQSAREFSKDPVRQHVARVHAAHMIRHGSPSGAPPEEVRRSAVAKFKSDKGLSDSNISNTKNAWLTHVRKEDIDLYNLIEARVAGEISLVEFVATLYDLKSTKFLTEAAADSLVDTIFDEELSLQD